MALAGLVTLEFGLLSQSTVKEEGKSGGVTVRLSCHRCIMGGCQPGPILYNCNRDTHHRTTIVLKNNR